MPFAIGSTKSRDHTAARRALNEEQRRVEKNEKDTRVQAASATATIEAPEKPSDVVRRDTRARSASDEAGRRLFFDGQRTEGGDRDPAKRSSTATFGFSGNAITVSRGRKTATSGETDLEASPETREVLRDPSDVNGTGVAQQGAAAMGLERNRAAEERRVASLDQSRRENYLAVAATTEGDPVSRRALQGMLLGGRFDGEPGQQLLGEIAGLSRDTVAEGIERDALVQDLVQEVADPTSINQQGYGTCAGTAASVYLARTDPAEYARLVRGLASPEGKVTLKNGDEISREERTVDEPESYEGGERSQSHRLLVPALMEYANRSTNYDPVEDVQRGESDEPEYTGLTNGDVDRIMEGLTGETWDSRQTDDGEAEVERIDAATEDGEAVLTSIDWGEGGHKLLVTDVTDDHVVYVNPWGQEERMSRDEFEDRFTGVNFAPTA